MRKFLTYVLDSVRLPLYSFCACVVRFKSVLAVCVVFARVVFVGSDMAVRVRVCCRLCVVVFCLGVCAFGYAVLALCRRRACAAVVCVILRREW